MSAERPPEQNPRIPEGINVSRQRPLRELVQLVIFATTIFLLLSFVLWHSFQFAARLIPLSWEAQLNDLLVESWSSEPAASDAHQQRQQMLQRRLDLLASGLEKPLPIEVTVHLVDSEMINAFASLGGHVFIMTGLLDQLHTEVGLDMVLAHELAHIVHRDPIQSAAGTAGLQLLKALLGSQGDFVQSLGLFDLGNRTMILNYSRRQETRADHTALQLLTQYHDDISDAGELFQLLHEQHDHWQGPAFFASHPHPQQRLEKIDAYIAEHN